MSVEQPNQTKPNSIRQTKLPNSTKAKQGWPKPSIQNKPMQHLANQTFSININSKLTASSKIKSRVPEMCARAAQLLYRPVLVGPK